MIPCSITPEALLTIVSLVPMVAMIIQAQRRPPKESVVGRFLRYVRIDTQSKEDQPTIPSTQKQFDLAHLLARELETLGAQKVQVSEHALVTSYLPGTSAGETEPPVLGFLAHLDTSPEVSGANVQPIIHCRYQGGDLVLPQDPAQVITVAGNPILQSMIGDDLITADGTTLLGADDKAGCAAIMTLIDTLQQNPEILRGPLAFAFTPDEETGKGIGAFDVKGFGAQYAFTVDGGSLGEVSEETWNARRATIHFQGKNTHPGTAKGIMVNSLWALADFLSRFPSGMLPETTEGRQGFFHPLGGALEVEQSHLKVLLRDFDRSGLDEKERMLRSMAEQTEQRFPGIRVSMEIKEEYQNMKEVLRFHPYLMEMADEATRRAGLTPKRKPIRGGTDGSKLTFAGLPCPDLFTGGQNYHSKLEFTSRRNLEKTTETLLNLVEIFAQRMTS